MLLADEAAELDGLLELFELPKLVWSNWLIWLNWSRLLTPTSWVTKVEGSIGDSGSWFCSCVISNCMNMLSALSLESELLLVLLVLLLLPVPVAPVVTLLLDAAAGVMAKRLLDICYLAFA